MKRDLEIAGFSFGLVYILIRIVPVSAISVGDIFFLLFFLGVGIARTWRLWK